MDKPSTVYMRKMQGIQDSLTYAMNQRENTSIQLFTNNYTTLKVFEYPNKCATLQIMQDTVMRLNILKISGKLVSFHWIFLYKDIKRIEEIDVIANKTMG